MDAAMSIGVHPAFSASRLIGVALGTEVFVAREVASDAHIGTLPIALADGARSITGAVVFPSRAHPLHPHTQPVGHLHSVR